MAGDGKLGFFSVTAIGVGGMVGGGIFAVLGLAVKLAHGLTPIAFLVGGAIALMTGFSYARLSVRYPSRGGTVVFLDRVFGVDLITGSLNSLLWASYVVMLALYAFAFGSYGATFAGGDHTLVLHVLITVGIVAPTVLNMLDAELIGRVETYIVAIKITVLVGFVAIGATGVDSARLAPSAWSPLSQIVAGGMIIFVAYEGFELIANSAEDVRDVKILPRALYASIGGVVLLYVAISAVAVGSLPVPKIVAAEEYALAAAAKPMLGHAGFVAISVAALLSTLSAINATLYGSARLSYTIAREGELPEILENKVWNKPIEGLLITAGLAVALANLGDLSSISTMGSAGFLLIFAAVNAANTRRSDEKTAARVVSAIACLGCLGALTALIVYSAEENPSSLWLLAVLLGVPVAVEVIFRVAGRDRLKIW